MDTRELIHFIKGIYRSDEFIPLHAPCFPGNERAYVNNTLDSTFVSSVGAYVEGFESLIEEYTGCARAVATVNGTSGLHAALYIAGVGAGDLVITQALTFVATCNAIHQLGASPVFVDVSIRTLGLCPQSLEIYLEKHAFIDDELVCRHRASGRPIRAILPMHTFGHPVELDELIAICSAWKIFLIEDAAESLGSTYKNKHTGTFGDFGVLSFNGNKIITTGGGGMVLCKSIKLGEHLKHVTTTAKVSHPYEFFHDEPGFNYRMPNLNAALGCAQMESLGEFLASKRRIAEKYEGFFKGSDFVFVKEPVNTSSNYWLNAVICPTKEDRDALLKQTNAQGVMTRPVWALMNRLPMFKDSPHGDLETSFWLEQRLVNLPSSPTRNVN